MRKIFTRAISGVLTAAMVVTLLPPSSGEAKAEEAQKLKEQLRNSVSDTEYPNGVFAFGKTQLSVKEGKKTTITVVRQGNTDNKAEVHFKTIDISAKYGSDYLLTVVHSSIKKEQLEAAEDCSTLMEQNALSDVKDDMEILLPETETIENVDGKEETTAKKASAKKTSQESQSGLAAVYQLQNGESAPAYDWKETNPENASQEITDAMTAGKEQTQEFLGQAAGTEAVLTFEPGEYQKEIIFDTLDDEKSESEEQVAFFLYDAEGSVIGADYNGYVNIKDNEEAESNAFSVKDSEVVVENDEDTAKVTIVRESGIDQMAFVTVGTKENTAIPGEDYEAFMEDILFPAGTKSQTVEIPIIGERTEDKTFYIGIRNDNEEDSIGNAAALVTIRGKEKTAKDSTSISAKSKEETISGVNTSLGNDKYVISNVNLQLADKVTVNYTVQGITSKKKCKKWNYYKDKRVNIYVRNASGKNILSFTADKNGQDSYTGNATFSRSMSKSSDFCAWDDLSSAKIWVQAIGLNDNQTQNVKIKVNSIKVNYPGFTFMMNNDSIYNYYKEKQFTSQSKFTEKSTEIRLGRVYIGSKNKESYELQKPQKLSFITEYSNAKNSQGVPANSNTVSLKGYRFIKPNGGYSEVINLASTTIDKAFLNKYKSYLYNGLTFSVTPVFEPKTAQITFNNNNATVNAKKNAKGNFKGYTAGSTLKAASKLDTLVIAGAAEQGYAISQIQISANKYAQTNEKDNTDKSSLTCGLGDNSNTSYTVSLYYEDANITVVADPKFTNTAEIKKGTVVYTDEDNNAFVGDYTKPLTIKNIIMNQTYNILGITEDGYRTVWRDGTLDYDGDGETTTKSNIYTPFTPVVGNVLPYTAKIALGKVYYSFEKQQVVGKPTDVYGFLKIRDRFILTGEKYEKGVNGANITVDGVQEQTTTGGTNSKNQSEGFFRIKSDTFSVTNYYLVNVNAYGDEGSINTSFVMNPGYIQDCVIDTAEDLKISDPEVLVKDKSGDYLPREISIDENGYYSELSNGDKDYRLVMKADKSGVRMAAAQLQFYDTDGKRLAQTVDGTAANTTGDGYFQFDFNPDTLQLPAGTTLRVTFTDNQGHTYLQREVGMSLSQAIGVLDIANSFTFGSANTIVKMIGKVDSAFDLGWNGDFDDVASDYITNDPETGDKILNVGFSTGEIKKKTKRTAIQSAANNLAKKEQKIADANKELAAQIKKVEKNPTTANKKELEDLNKKAANAYAARDEEKKKYEEAVKGAQNPSKTHTSLASSVNLDVSFSFVMTFGRDAGNYYFKSMLLNASIEGGASITVKFSTPIGISINLGLAAGGSGSATFVVEERKDLMHPQKYYIQSLQEEGGEGGIDVLNFDPYDANRKFDASGSFSLKPYITLSVGAGVLGDLISVTISGTAQFDMQFFTDNRENNGSVNLSSSLTVKVLMISHSWTLVSADINLFGNSRSASLGTDELNYLYEPADTLQAQDISYMKGGTRWKSGKISAKSIDENPEGYAESTLGDKIAENPDFKMISIGDGKYLAVFTNVDTTRENTLNAKAIYYTVYDGRSWGEPQLIEDDGTLDQDPNVFDLGEHGAVITWSTADKVFNDTTSRVDMQNSLNLHCIFFDKSTQSLSGDIQEVTKTTTDSSAANGIDYSDCCADVSANVSYNDEKMIVYYQKKEYAAEDEELLGDVLFPAYSLMGARTYSFNNGSSMNGTWSDTYTDAQKAELGLSDAEFTRYENCFYGQRLFPFLPAVRVEENLDEEGYWTESGDNVKVSELDDSSCMILDTDAMSYNDLGVFAYTVDYDGDLDTCEDRDVYMQIYDFKKDAFLHPIVLTGDDVEDAKVQFARVHKLEEDTKAPISDTYLTWLRDGDIVALNMSNIVGNYQDLLITETASNNAEYYRLKKEKPPVDGTLQENGTYYEAPITIVEGKATDAPDETDSAATFDLEETNTDDKAISSITDFDVESSEDYVYFVWTQTDATLKDGVEDGSYEAMDPANALTETQMYTARFERESGITTKPVQITSGKGANYSDVAFKVENDNLIGLAYKADSKIVTLEEYNERITENNKSAQAGSNGDGLDANETVELATETSYVPFSEADIENAKPYSFRVNPKSVVKVKNAAFGEAQAGQDTTVTFDILNDGIDTVPGLKLTATDKDGKSVLVGTSTTEDDGNSEITESIVDSITLDDLYGGYSYSGTCRVTIPENATSAEVTIKVTDKNGNELASEKVSETLESLLSITKLKAEPTDVRNQYTITGTITNDGRGLAPAGEITIGSVKRERKDEASEETVSEKTYGTVTYPELPIGDSYEFEKVVTVSPTSDFVIDVATDGSVAETGTIYARADIANSETVIERTANAEEMAEIHAIKNASLEDVTGDRISIQAGNSIILNPVVSSSLADAANEITGDERLQYKFLSDNEDVLTVNSYGVAEALKKGTATVTMYAYPKNNLFVATQSDSASNVLGQYEDTYITAPENAVYKKTFTAEVTDGSSSSSSGSSGGSSSWKPSSTASPTPTPDSTASPTPNPGGADGTASPTVKPDEPSSTVSPTVEPDEPDTSAPPAQKSLAVGATFTSNGYQYKVKSSTQVTFIGVKNANAKKVVIPATVKVNGKSYKVTSIAARAFAGNKKLTTITIGNNIQTIGKAAFKKCTKLTKVAIPKKVTKIKANTFANCSALKSVTFQSNKLTTIGKGAFKKCTKLTKITITKNVTKIKANAFASCSALKNVTVKSTKLKSIGKNAFKDIKKKAVFTLPGTKKQKKKLKKLFTQKTGFNSKTMQIK